ncbi:U3 small nucleolar RNA-associated protein 22 [Spathaspora sp. JA1]|nr:U3 small nucleolar RNA-associated protein 22 [Spathaspora sp. JA1]
MVKRKLEDSIQESSSDLAKDETEFTSFSDREQEKLNGEEHQESDDDDEEEEEEEEEQERPSKKPKKQLSAQDVQVARETAELFKSNIFKLQIDELLKEIKIKDTHVVKIEKVLHRLHDLISQIPEVNDLTLQQVEALFNSKKIVIPFPDPKPNKLNYKFSYLPPEDVSLVGSFGLKTATSGSNSIDIALTMSKKLFQAKDYLNYRALYKRAFYLTYLANQLIPLSKKNNLPIKISYHYLNGDVLNPVLSLQSIETDNPEDLTFSKTKFHINLIAALPFGIFEYKKLLPDKNCIRVQTDQKDDTVALPPTPVYNSSILSQTAYDYYLKYLYTINKTTDGFKDACMLGRLWLQQRGFSSDVNKGGFGHFEFAMLMSILLNGGGIEGNKILLHGFSSYQLFKGVVKYLATMDLTEGYVSFSSLIGEKTSAVYKSQGFQVPTIFDKNIKLNLLWKMSKSSYQQLQIKARETLMLLNDVVKDRFDSILLQNSNFSQLKYDLVCNLTIPDKLVESFNPLEKISFITFENYIKNKLYIILKTALGERVSLVHIESEEISTTFPINKRKPNSSNTCFNIGLTLNAEESDKLVTKGPNNQDTEAGLKFRSFWGSKAQLRRFKDGTIQHCVVWTSTTTEPIVLTIMKYVLDIHLYQDISSNLTSDTTHFSNKLPVPLSGNAITLTNFTALRNSFEQLNKIMTGLELPLNVKSILPGSSGLRYTSLVQPIPFAVSNPDFWNDCILQFETSTRWPDEISTLEKTKTAFLLKIHEVLKQTNYSSFITKDDSIPYNSSISLLNVLTPEGYGFRFRVLTERDEVLYLRAVDNSGKTKAIVQDVYLKFNAKYLGVVKHTRTISVLAQHFHSYSATVRLFKQWLDSQLLLTHFNDELIELIAIKPFVDPSPYSIPHSIESGFLQILNFLASWNWKQDPLILDLVKSTADDKLSDKLTIQAYRVIQSNFDKIRKLDPVGLKTQLFIGSKDDPSGILWSNEITLPIATRLTALSRAAINLIKTQGISESNLDLIFTPALHDYDFVIHLNSSDLTVSSGILPPNTFKNLIQPLTSFPEDITTKYDLTQAYFTELNNKFGNTIIFSIKKSPCNDNVICGLFIPDHLNRKKFRVNLGYNVKPDSEESVIINKDAIYDQIKIMGGDLIKSIDIKK